MLSKEEYIELYVKGGQAINAILEVLNNLVEVKVEIDGEEAIKIIRDFQQKYFDLIDEHFKPKENTSEFKHFKPHSDSSLKNLTKVELIDYIKMLYHNWGVTDEQLKRIIDKAKELSDSNDELRRQLYFIEPYKFEDLKPNMWVWDNVAKECLYVVRPFITTGVRVKYFTCLGLYNSLEAMKKLNMKFEENRFFPVQCANLES